jgi:hypothetical protein
MIVAPMSLFFVLDELAASNNGNYLLALDGMGIVSTRQIFQTMPLNLKEEEDVRVCCDALVYPILLHTNTPIVS